MIQYIEGNLITLAKQGKFDVIAHGCNCYQVMGGGIAKQIKNSFPEAYQADLKTQRGSRNKLGTISCAVIDNCITVVNCYTQYNYGSGKHTDYDALRSCLKEIKNKFSGSRIGLPFIGAGLGGGDWKIIVKIIEEELIDENVVIVKYKANQF
jgi:O-acetyl-ADP-ribose deacetylase (regulator of RNase III)